MDESKSSGEKERYKLLVEGTDFLGVLRTVGRCSYLYWSTVPFTLIATDTGVNGLSTTSNHTTVVEAALGIEAARLGTPHMLLRI